MKKVVLLVLVACMLLACFAGCGGTASTTTEVPTSTPAPTTSAPETQTAAEPDEPASLYPLAEAQTLTVLGPIYAPRAGGIVETWQDTTFYQAASEATNIWLDYECVATEAYKTQFNIVLAGGDLPDMFFQALQHYSGSPDQAIEEGIFANIADYLEYCPDYVNALDQYGYTKNVTTDIGNMVTFYMIGKNPPSPLVGFVIRQDLLDELGMSAPETYDEYYDVLMALKTEYDLAEPLTMGYMGAVNGDWLCSGFGVSLYSHFMDYANKGFYQVNGQVKYGFLEDGFKEYATLMAQWFNDGLITSDFPTENENFSAPEYLNKISGGETGIALIDSSYIVTLENAGDIKLSPVQDAVKNKGDQTHLSSCKDKDMVATYIVSADCGNMEAAMLWNNYWYTEEGSMLSNWGIEGETYNIVNGKPQFTDLLLNNPDGLTLSQTSYVYIGQLGLYDTARNLAMYSPRVSELPETWGINKDNAYKIPTGVSMTADESSAYNSVFTDINTYVQENLVKFVVGQKPLSELDAFVDELYAIGVEECLGYWQAALDRFNQR